MQNKIIYRRKDSTYNREKFKKPIHVVNLLILLFIGAAFNDTLEPFAILGIMVSLGALLVLSLLYFNRPLEKYDKQEYVYVKFKDSSIELSLREKDLLVGEMRKYLVKEVKYPKVTYQIFEVPYNKITSIKEYMPGNYGRSTYRIFYESQSKIMKPCVMIIKEDFDLELWQWLVQTRGQGLV